jgi:hypothetical protein
MRDAREAPKSSRLGEIKGRGVVVEANQRHTRVRQLRVRQKIRIVSSFCVPA